MTHDDDTGEDALAAINLHAWRVPPVPVQDRATILARALTPAMPRKRRRTAWLVGAFAIANAVLAAILLLLVSRKPDSKTVIVQAAGGGPVVDPQTQDVLRRLEAEQRDLERKLAEVQQLRTVVEQLAERVRKCEQSDNHDKRDQPAPAPAPAPSPVPAPAPQPSPAPDPLATSCDEVSCVLTNYNGLCCDKYRRTPPPAPAPDPNALPDGLDRAMISSAMGAVRTQVLSCGAKSTAKGIVKVKVLVAPEGRPTNVVVLSTPDAPLGACVAAAVQRAKFARTQHGGSFSYPFVFDASP